MSAPASQRIIDLFDFLRSTGSHLPCSNSECASLILSGLEILQPDEPDDDNRFASTVDQLVADFQVIVEEIESREHQAEQDAGKHS